MPSIFAVNRLIAPLFCALAMSLGLSHGVLAADVDCRELATEAEQSACYDRAFAGSQATTVAAPVQPTDRSVDCRTLGSEEERTACYEAAFANKGSASTSRDVDCRTLGTERARRNCYNRAFGRPEQAPVATAAPVERSDDFELPGSASGLPALPSRPARNPATRAEADQDEPIAAPAREGGRRWKLPNPFD